MGDMQKHTQDRHVVKFHKYTILKKKYNKIFVEENTFN